MEGSPTSQQSQRSRPSFRHPILLEDGSSGAADAAPGSPTSTNNGSPPSSHDHEARIEATLSYSRPNASNTSLGSSHQRIPSGPSSPSSHQFHPPPHAQVYPYSSPHPDPFATPPSAPATMPGNQQPYYHGIVTLAGSSPPPQGIPITPNPAGGFLCDHCGSTFTRAHDLRRHYTSKHAEVKSQCVCGKNFSRRDALLRHQRPDPVSGYGGCEEAQAAAATP